VTDAAGALTHRYPVVVVSLGADGALWATPEETVYRPAHPTTVVDTTGAGDAFAAGLLAEWAAAGGRPDPVTALAAGLARAAMVVSRPGAR
jgi:sugar/nucleoside kinase (ribokinase family)